MKTYQKVIGMLGIIIVLCDHTMVSAMSVKDYMSQNEQLQDGTEDNEDEEYLWDGPMATEHFLGWPFTGITEKAGSINHVKDVEGKVTIPSKLNGYDVLGINYHPCTIQDLNDFEPKEENIFLHSCADKVTEVVIENGIEYIGCESFAYLPNLKKVSLPNSLKRIDNYAFMGTGLCEVTIPNHTSYIGPSAFYGCDLLERINFSGMKKVVAVDGLIDTPQSALDQMYGTTGVLYVNTELPAKKMCFSKSVDEIGNIFDWESVTTIISNNPSCKFVTYGQSSEKGTYEYLKNHPNFCVIAPKGSTLIQSAKKFGMKYKEIQVATRPTVTKNKNAKNVSYLKWKKEKYANKYQVFYKSSRSGTYRLLTTTSKLYYCTNKKGYYRIRGYRTYENMNFYGAYTTVKM